MNEVVYTHRPLLGVSVAATSHEDRLFVAVSKVNNGESLAGNFNSEHRDTFSRRMARNILNGRLQNAIDSGEGTSMSSVFDEPVSARDFIREFRTVFKPSLDETDDTFMISISLAEMLGIGSSDVQDEMSISVRMSVVETVNKIRDLVSQAVAACREASN